MTIFQLSNRQLILLAKNAWAFGEKFIVSDFVVTHNNDIHYQRDGQTYCSVKFEVEVNQKKHIVLYCIYPTLNSSIGYYRKLDNGVLCHDQALPIANQHFMFKLLEKWGVEPEDYSSRIVEEYHEQNVPPNPLGAKKLVIRPMYKSDKQYRKGMNVLVLDIPTGGNWITRHVDPSKIRIPEEYSHLDRMRLPFEDIDWQEAGYPNVKKKGQEPIKI